MNCILNFCILRVITPILIMHKNLKKKKTIYSRIRKLRNAKSHCRRKNNKKTVGRDKDEYSQIKIEYKNGRER